MDINSLIEGLKEEVFYEWFDGIKPCNALSICNIIEYDETLQEIWMQDVGVNKIRAKFFIIFNIDNDYSSCEVEQVWIDDVVYDAVKPILEDAINNWMSC